MWITADVNLPPEVVAAHTDGELVLFVGAGASMDPPSNLPSFTKLAKDLARAARVPFDDAQPLDTFLGSLPSNFDVHVHARNHIAQPESRFNPTHSALIAVASSTAEFRVVTTNFDDHLARAAGAEGVEIRDRWVGPALPLGRDFRGLVHLHGSVLRHASELVLTDSDFGRAYLTDAWATRFLQQMFERFTVLFVGYSHDDPIMRYLSLGLPPKTRRYVIHHHPDDKKWQHLGIEAIGYPAPNNDHSALVDALRAWATRTRMGRLEHQALMQDIIEGGPSSMTPVDEDYLDERLRSVAGARDFAQTARTIDWLRWMEGRSEFRALFAGAPTEDVGDIMSGWFANTFVSDPTLQGAALQTVQRLGQHFASPLFSAVGWAAAQLKTTDPAAGQRWEVLLLTSVSGHSAPPALDGIVPYEAGEVAQDLVALRVAFRASISLRRSWWVGQDDWTTPPDAELRWTASEHTLSSHAKKVVEEFDAGDSKLGSLLEEAINSAYDLLAGYQGASPSDPFHSRRSAIEPHVQDSHRDPVDALIDALRDYGQKALPGNQWLPDRWWGLGRAIFRRLALHLIGNDDTKSPDEKLAWLLDRDALYDFDVKHEAYQVIAATVAEAGEDVRARLLQLTVVGPTYPYEIPDADRHTSYGIYNLLIWLTSAAPEWLEAADLLAEVQEANPSFEPREHPDLDTWASDVVWGGQAPIDPEDFINAAEHDLDAALEELTERDYSERNFEDPAWEDALAVVGRVAETRPDIGESLWCAISTREGLREKAGDLRRAVINGWTQADLGDNSGAIAAFVASEVLHEKSARAIGQFLVEQGRRRMDSPDTATLNALRDIAVALWASQGANFKHSETSDPSFLALNTWPGDLVRFWTSEIDRRWRRDQENWTGFDENEREALIALLAGPAPAEDAVVPAIASQAFFLFAADEAFGREYVLPLFERGPRTSAAWEAYLYHPRYNDRMLAAGLLSGAVGEWERLDELQRSGLERQFLGLVASIITFAGISDDDRQQLLDQSVLASGGAHAPAFAESVRGLIESPKVDATDVWSGWLREHLTARLNGLPRLAEAEELARWADLAPLIGPHAEAAFELLRGHKIGLGEAYQCPEWPTELLERAAAALVEHLVERVQHSSPDGWRTQHAVRQMLTTLRSALGEATCRPLIRAATERGFPLDRL